MYMDKQKFDHMLHDILTNNLVSDIEEKHCYIMWHKTSASACNFIQNSINIFGQ